MVDVFTVIITSLRASRTVVYVFSAVTTTRIRSAPITEILDTRETVKVCQDNVPKRRHLSLRLMEHDRWDIFEELRARYLQNLKVWSDVRACSTCNYEGCW